MDLKSEKLDIIQWLTQLTDETIIAKIKAIRGEKADWWDEMPDSVRQDISMSLKESEDGNSRSHDDVMQELRSDYYEK